MGVPPQQLALARIALLLLICTQNAAAGVTVKFEGLEGEMEAAARNNLELLHYAEREVSPSQANRLFAKAEEEIRIALNPYGYYDAQVQGDLQHGAKPGDYEAAFKVTLGAPVVVRELKVAVDGTGKDLPAVRDALAAFKPRVGERLEHGIYEGSKAQISNLLLSRGYFDSKLERRRVAVTQGAKTADIDVAWTSGERYRFGDVRFSEVQFPDEFLRRYIPWESGTYYSTEQLLTLQQRLVDADYFSSVAVQPNLAAKAGAVMPIEALLIPAKQTVYKAGAYVSTDTGPGVRFGIDRRWLNDRGHKFGVKLDYATKREEYSVYYRIPRPGRNNRSFNFAGGYEDEETDSSRSRMAKLAASEVLDDWHGYTRTLGLQYLHGDFEIADEQNSTSLLYFDGMLTRRRTNDVMFPTKGLSVLYGVRLSHESQLSETSLAQARAEAKWVRPAGKHSRLIMRAAVGAMVVDDFDALPPELRFFAGGDRSVRGFDYEQIGEKNDAGGVIGGKYLTVASVEYERFFLPKWGASLFVDAGDAYSSDLNANIGAGIGVRWKSPVGLVRLDVAIPVVTDEEKEVRFHIVIGPDL